MRRDRSSGKSGWALYWVASDGEQDCFVVAKSSRSARTVEADYCGFEPGDLTVYRVKPISASVARLFEKRRVKEGHAFGWPWYADEWLLKKVGAQTRERNGFSETLIDDVVYSQGGNTPRTIGRRFLREFGKSKMSRLYSHGDEFSSSQKILFTLLGICVARCQEIESLIAHSFILTLTDSERKKYRTFKELIRGWETKTLGQMLRSMEQTYEVEERVHASLNLFLRMRNQLIHGLTTSQQYDIESTWGQSELVAFLALFEFLSRMVRRAFRSTYYASILFANMQVNANDPQKQLPLTSRQITEARLYPEIFKVRISERTELKKQ